MRIEREEVAALVIDFQERLMPVMSQKDEVIKNTSILLEGLRILEVPMCITQQYTAGLGMTIAEITNAVGDTAYIDKIEFSAYSSVKEFVDGKKYVIICGIETHICVLQTVVDLLAAGHTPVLVVDCIDSRKKLDKEIGIERARLEGAIITTYESLLFELLKKAKTSTSKAIQKLIK